MPGALLIYRQKGFTLLELAISMVIVGLLMVGAVSAYTVYNQKEQVTKTQSNIDEVNEAIAAFQQEHGFFPCPAAPGDASASSGPGTASDCSVGTGAPDGVPNAQGLISNVTGQMRPALPAGLQNLRVRIGVVPITVNVPGEGLRQLVSGERMVDGWRNRLTYAVIEQMAMDGPTFNAAGTGAIRIQRRGGGPDVDGTARFIVLSHGPDGVGAYTATGAVRQPCGVGSDDDINCDGDNVFTSIGLAGTRSTTGDNNNFDDFVVGDTRSPGLGCTADQEISGINWRTHTVNCTPRNPMTCGANTAFVGLIPIVPGNPAAGLQADCRSYAASCSPGYVLVSADDSGTTCIKNMQGNCPDGYVQNGTEDFVDTNNDGLDDISGRPVAFGKEKCVKVSRNCGPNQIQVGISDGTDIEGGSVVAAGQPLCANRMKTDVCTGNTILIGYNSDGSPNCSYSPVCTGGKVVSGIVNGQLQCTLGVSNASCPSGQAVVNVTNGVATCGDVVSTGDILVVNSYVESGPGYAGAYNYYFTQGIDAYATGFSPPSSHPHYATWQARCLLASDDDMAGFTKVQKDEFCSKMYCRGKTGIHPSMAQSNEGCPQTPSDPICNTSFGIQFDCFTRL